MRAILADNTIQRHLRALLTILQSPAWVGLWQLLGLPLRTFRDLGLAPDVGDSVLWRRCQIEQIVLITANRNASGPGSLEATLRLHNRPDRLPVFTLADADRVLHSRDYAERVVERLLDYLIDIDNYRGPGRLYLP
jgi:hypothetical protein